MKLIYAIVNRDDSKNVLTNLTKSGYYVTKLATTGGFLGSGNTTFMICDDDEKVDDIVNIISKYSRKRRQTVPGDQAIIMEGVTQPAVMPIEVTVGGATVIVTDVAKFMKL
jgi:uncharacterized protein YaaQ